MSHGEAPEELAAAAPAKSTVEEFARRSPKNALRNESGSLEPTYGRLTTMQRILLLLTVLALAPFVLGACGGDDDGSEGGGGEGDAAATTSEGDSGGAGNAEAGAEVFASAGCGGCHTLKAADATGTKAPNLDELRPSEAEVREQVTNGGGGMPAFKDKLSEQQIADVAAYVAMNAGS